MLLTLCSASIWPGSKTDLFLLMTQRSLCKLSANEIRSVFECPSVGFQLCSVKQTNPFYFIFFFFLRANVLVYQYYLFVKWLRTFIFKATNSCVKKEREFFSP